MSPLLKSVEEAGIQGIRSKRNPARIRAEDFFADSDHIRKLFATLIGAVHARSVSIAPSVSYGVAVAAKNLTLQPGQEILVLHEQFPSNMYSWRRLAAERKLKLRVVHPPDTPNERGRIWNERILDALSPQTGAVCLPHVHWADGTLFDLESISDRVRDVGAALVIDGTQSVGALPFDVQRIQPDVLVCAGYKWLLGPYSVALAYWSDRMIDGIPIEENWITRRESRNFAGLVDYDDRYDDGAVRYDVGERSNFILVPMMMEALRQVSEWGPARIQEYARDLTVSPVREIRDMGFSVESDTLRSGHLFGIRVPDSIPLDRARAALRDHSVSASIRGNAIRIAVHAFNDSDDMDALTDALRTCIPVAAH